MAYDINSLLVAEAGRIGPDIHKKVHQTSPWLRLVKQGNWPEGMGNNVSVMTYERTIPNAQQIWQAINFNANASGSFPSPTTGFQAGANTVLNAVPPETTINLAQTIRQYNLTHSAVRAPNISVNDLRYSWMAEQQLKNLFDCLTDSTKWTWENRRRDEYIRSCGNKTTITSTGLNTINTTDVDPNVAVINDATTGSVPGGLAGALFDFDPIPMSRLTQGVLDYIGQIMLRDGAGDGAMSMVNGKPQFGLICSPEASDAILVRDIKTREDVRFNDAEVGKLLGPMGVDRSYRGFFHMCDSFMPRYDIVTSGSARLIRRYPYRLVAATYGNKADISNEYRDAVYEVSVVFHKEVMESLIPKPITSPGGGTKFDPVSYKGEFKWLNIPHQTDNPDGTIGFFRGVLGDGTKPIRPEWGWAILHQRVTGVGSLGLVDVTAGGYAGT